MIGWIKNKLWKSHDKVLNPFCGEFESEEIAKKRLDEIRERSKIEE